MAAPGLEELVANELTALGVAGTTVVEGGVEFPASRLTLFETNLHLRTASRVLIRLARFRAVSFAELERRARTVPWETVVRKGDEVVLRVTCRKSRLYHSDAVAERLMRDLVNRFGVPATAARRDDAEEDPGNAQLIVVRLDHDTCTISADSSGAHLHQRGYRVAVTQAPMRETLAAALVIASGWDRKSPLIDPFCGSGTIPIEAALFAARIAPGIGRRFRFTEWPGHDTAVWERVLEKARRAEHRAGVPLVEGSDRSAAAIRAARDNAQRARVGDLVRFEQKDVSKLAPGAGLTGWVVSNPPYGVRLGDATTARRLMRQFGAAMVRGLPGWHVTLLSQVNPGRDMGIALHERMRTVNGGLRVQVLTGDVPVPEDAAGPSRD